MHVLTLLLTNSSSAKMQSNPRPKGEQEGLMTKIMASLRDPMNLSFPPYKYSRPL